MDTKKQPVTLEDWRVFMNGYRDPKTREIIRAEKLRELEVSGNKMPPMGGGGDAARECGYRKEGGTYAVVPTSPYGRPIDDFLLCKPLPINKDEYNLSNVGVRLVDLPETCYKCKGKETKGAATCQTCYGTGQEIVTHIFDIIGQEYYPNIADFVEEARRLGISRRCELETAKEYSRLSSRSKLFFLHHKAIIKNPEKVLEGMKETEVNRLVRAGCPRNLNEHSLAKPGLVTSPGCSALYWNVLEGGEVIPEFYNNLDNSEVCPVCKGQTVPENFGTCDNCNSNGFVEKYSRFVERKLVSGTYRGYALREDVKPDYTLGVFAIFPLGRLEVVDPSGEYEDRVERASSAKLDVVATEC